VRLERNSTHVLFEWPAKNFVLTDRECLAERPAHHLATENESGSNQATTRVSTLSLPWRALERCMGRFALSSRC